ncbi:MAG: glycoside hydrolase family 3 N-terminal domain-containing protein, partial [Myxococcota bacterium]
MAKNKIDPGELFWLGFQGTCPPDSLKNILTQGNCGGIILFSRNIQDYKQLHELNCELDSLWKEKTTLPLGVDQEGGRVQRINNIN